MIDTERSREDLQLALAEHYRQIRAIESCMRGKWPEEPMSVGQDPDSDHYLWVRIIDTIPSAVAIVRANGSLSMVNRRWLEIYGDSLDGIDLERHIERMKPVWPDRLPVGFAEMPGVRALTKGEMTRNQEMIIHKQDGSELPVLVSAAPLVDENGKIVAAVVVFDDILEYKKIQRTLAESKRDLARQTFLFKLAEAMRPLEDAVEIQNLVTRMLGEHMQVDRALYGEMEDDHVFIVKRDYHLPGLNSFAGHYSLDIAAPVLVSQLHAGQTNVVQDVFSEIALTDRERHVYQDRELTAFIMVPLVKAGRLVAFLRVQCNAPHKWTEGDVRLVEEIAERTWAAVERAQAEETLRTAERTYRSILDNSQDGILLLDLETMRYRYISQSHADHTGFTLEELYNMSMEEINGRVHPDDRQATLEKYQAAVTDLAESDEIEYRWLARNGEYHWFRDRRKFILDEQGKGVAMVVVSRDVTRWKENERRIAFQAHLLEKVHDAIIATDDEYRISYWNESAEKIFRWPAGEAVGRRLLSLLRTLDQDSDSDGSITSMIRQDNFAGEVKYHRKNGETLYLDVQTSVIRDPKGHLQETISSVRDITIRKMAELQLRESEQRATSLVEQLQRYDRNRNDFLNALSHELRNPLAAIVSSLDLLAMTAGGNPQVGKLVPVLKRQTRHLTRLVDDLLDVTRIMNNKIRLRKELVNLTELLQCSLDDIRAQYEAKGVRIVTNLPDEPIALLADSQRLAQVINNLLHNALKFTKAGGSVQVAATRDPSTRSVTISIADSGEGIAPDMLTHIFEPFKQVEQTLARSQGGLGLGLSIVRSIVELHGGTVQASSAGLGKGATFTVRLPVSTRPDEPVNKMR